jgi:hypothetical protein
VEHGAHQNQRPRDRQDRQHHEVQHCGDPPPAKSASPPQELRTLGPYATGA